MMDWEIFPKPLLGRVQQKAIYVFSRGSALEMSESVSISMASRKVDLPGIGRPRSHKHGDPVRTFESVGVYALDDCQVRKEVIRAPIKGLALEMRSSVSISLVCGRAALTDVQEPACTVHWAFFWRASWQQSRQCGKAIQISVERRGEKAKGPSTTHWSLWKSSSNWCWETQEPACR
ncbi:hypothetical protein SK128_017426, partial [Halocaridina rubra]